MVMFVNFYNFLCYSVSDGKGEGGGGEGGGGVGRGVPT